MDHPKSAIPNPQSADPFLSSIKEAEASAVAAGAVSSAADLIPLVKVPDPRDQNAGLVPMESWPLAVELVSQFWPGNKRTATIKPRQMGVSWDFALFCLHHASTPYRCIGSFNYNQEAAGELLRRMQVLWATLPPSRRLALRPGTRWNTQHVEFANGTRAVALPTTDVAGAGLTFSLAGVDEAGLIKNLDTNWPAILPAVEHGGLHLFSTPRDAAGKFFEIITQARAGEGVFRLREIHWSERPGRDEAWKRKTIAEIGLKNFRREYELAFTRPGDAYFDDAVIEAVKRTTCAPREILWRDRLRIWKRPDPHRRYVIGADVAEGLQDGDYSTAGVVDPVTGEEVAAYHAHVNVTEYGEDLVRLGRMYNNAWLAIEANNHGHAVCAWVYHHCRYRRVFREWRKDEGALGAPAARLGLLTTSQSKPAMLAGLEFALRRQTLTIYDAAAAEEMATYLCLPGGEYGAGPGQHDDRVMRLCLGQQARGMPVPRTA